MNSLLLAQSHKWENPVDEVSRTWPWSVPPDVTLTGIRLEDVGVDLQPPILHPPPPLKTKSPCSVWNQEDDPLVSECFVSTNFFRTVIAEPARVCSSYLRFLSLYSFTCSRLALLEAVLLSG